MSMIEQFATQPLIICVLTNNCNQKCKYCSESAGCGDIHMLPYEMIDNLLKDIYDVSEDAIVSFIGGEATIWPEFYKLLGGKNFRNIKYKSLYTNATAISERNLLNIKNAGFFEVRVSVDSDRKEDHDMLRGEGTFERAVSFIKRMIENNIPVTVGTVLQKSNTARLNYIVDFLKTLDVQMIHFFPLYLKGRGKSQSELELDESDKTSISTTANF